MENPQKILLNFNGEECELTLAIILQDYPIHQTDDKGIDWYIINDQFCKKSNGQYVQINEQGVEQPILNQNEIKITLDYNDYLYSGKVTENQISKQLQILYIREVFTELVEKLQNYKNIQDGPIQLMIKQDQTIVLQFIYKINVSKITTKSFDIIFTLVKQEQTLESTFEKKIEKLKKAFEQEMWKQKQEILQLKHIQNNENQQYNNKLFINYKQNEESQIHYYDSQTVNNIFFNSQNDIKAQFSSLQEQYLGINQKYDEQSKRLLQLENYQNENTVSVQYCQENLKKEVSEIKDGKAKIEKELQEIKNSQAKIEKELSEISQQNSISGTNTTALSFLKQIQYAYLYTKYTKIKKLCENSKWPNDNVIA